MPLILSIDTSENNATLAIAEDGRSLSMLSNDNQKKHSTWIHTAIEECCALAGIGPQSLNAVGITCGPGSYTGLRIGMATAKGICYALKIPIIAVNTLHAMAYCLPEPETDYLCPMMDAGRMEVYAALYTRDVSEVAAPEPIILDGSSFSSVLKEKTITFFGTGKNKFEAILQDSNAAFVDFSFNAADMSRLIYEKFVQSDFSSLAYLEPLYLKGYPAAIN